MIYGCAYIVHSKTGREMLEVPNKICLKKRDLQKRRIRSNPKEIWWGALFLMMHLHEGHKTRWCKQIFVDCVVAVVEKAT